VADIAIQLPDELKSYLEREAERRGFKDVSQYVQKLIEAEQARTTSDEIERSLLETLDDPFTPLTDKNFDDIRREGDAEIARRRRLNR